MLILLAHRLIVDVTRALIYLRLVCTIVKTNTTHLAAGLGKGLRRLLCRIGEDLAFTILASALFDFTQVDLAEKLRQITLV